MKIKNSNRKNILGRLLPATAMFIALVLCFNFFSPTFFVRGSEGEALTSTEETAEEIETSETDEGLSYCLKKMNIRPLDGWKLKKVSHGDVIEVSYKVHSIYSGTDFIVRVDECEGVKLLSDNEFAFDLNKSDVLTLKFQLADDFDFGELSFYFIRPERTDEPYTYKKDIAFCHEGDYDYVSWCCTEDFVPFSPKVAEYYEALYNAGWRIYSDVDSPSGEPASYAPIVNSCTVEGHVWWTDDNDGIHPAHGVTVKIYNIIGSSENLVATTTTSADGYYSETIPTNGMEQCFKIRVYTSGTNIAVKNMSNNVYMLESSTSVGIENVEIDYTATRSETSGLAGSPYNCDLLPVSGNETDAKVDFIAVTGGYKIKLHNYDLYLTANSSSNGANVYWAASSSSNYQLARWCNLE